MKNKYFYATKKNVGLMLVEFFIIESNNEIILEEIEDEMK